MKKLDHVLLIDDNEDDNFFHKRIINRCECANHVEAKLSASEAIEDLTAPKTSIPDLILLDINMPEMNGWDFLEKYQAISQSIENKPIIYMLTTSENPDDIDRANKSNIDSLKGYMTKPLNEEKMRQIIKNHFS